MGGASKPLLVGVKFCGNCNPHVDTPNLLKQLISQSEEMSFISWEENKYDLLLILSSCPIDCATRPDFSGPTVVISGSMVNRVQVPKNLLINTLLELLNELKEGG